MYDTKAMTMQNDKSRKKKPKNSFKRLSWKILNLKPGNFILGNENLNDFPDFCLVCAWLLGVFAAVRGSLRPLNSFVALLPFCASFLYVFFAIPFD
jgi:hypothetical protein